MARDLTITTEVDISEDVVYDYVLENIGDFLDSINTVQMIDLIESLDKETVMDVLDLVEPTEEN